MDDLLRMESKMSPHSDDEFQDMDPSDLAKLQPLLCRLNNSALSPRSRMEQEKRIRREIANSNERRRMQSINAGFQSLKMLLPKRDGEKMSKAAILQQTAQALRHLNAEKGSLMQQNLQLKQLIENMTTAGKIPPPAMNPNAGLLATLPVHNQHNHGAMSMSANHTVSIPEITPPQMPSSTTEVAMGRLLSPSMSSSAFPSDRIKSEKRSPGWPLDSDIPLKKRKNVDSQDSSPSDDRVSNHSADTMSDGEVKTSSPSLPQAACSGSNPTIVSMAASDTTVTTTSNTPARLAVSSAMHPMQQPSHNHQPLSAPPDGIWDLKKELSELRMALDRERRSRLVLEDQVRGGFDLNRVRSNIQAFTNPLALPVLEYGTPGGLLSIPAGMRMPGIPSNAESLSALRQSQLTNGDIRHLNNTHESLNGINKHSIDALVQAASSAASQKIVPFAPKPTYQKPQMSGGNPAPVSSAPGIAVHKQNIDTIMDAIRHLEGDQLFVETGNNSLLENQRKLLVAAIEHQNFAANVASMHRGSIDSGIGSPPPMSQAQMIGFGLRPQLVSNSAQS